MSVANSGIPCLVSSRRSEDPSVSGGGGTLVRRTLKELAPMAVKASMVRTKPSVSNVAGTVGTIRRSQPSASALRSICFGRCPVSMTMWVKSRASLAACTSSATLKETPSPVCSRLWRCGSRHHPAVALALGSGRTLPGERRWWFFPLPPYGLRPSQSFPSFPHTSGHPHFCQHVRPHVHMFTIPHLYSAAR